MNELMWFPADLSKVDEGWNLSYFFFNPGLLLNAAFKINVLFLKAKKTKGISPKCLQLDTMGLIGVEKMLGLMENAHLADKTEKWGLVMSCHLNVYLNSSKTETCLPYRS